MELKSLGLLTTVIVSSYEWYVTGATPGRDRKQKMKNPARSAVPADAAFSVHAAEFFAVPPRRQFVLVEGSFLEKVNGQSFQSFENGDDKKIQARTKAARDRLFWLKVLFGKK